MEEESFSAQQKLSSLPAAPPPLFLDCAGQELNIKWEPEERELDLEHSDPPIEHEPCLICLNPNAGGVLQCQSWSSPEEGEELDDEPLSLRRNMSSIFLLRHLLHYPSQECARLLSTSGGLDPGSWCSLCEECCERVGAAYRLHRDVLKLQMKIEAVGAGLRGQLEKSLMMRDDDDSRRRRDFQHEYTNPTTSHIIRGYFLGSSRVVRLAQTTEDIHDGFNNVDVDIGDDDEEQEDEEPLMESEEREVVSDEEETDDDSDTTGGGGDEDPLYIPGNQENSVRQRKTRPSTSYLKGRWNSTAIDDDEDESTRKSRRGRPKTIKASGKNNQNSVDLNKYADADAPPPPPPPPPPSFRFPCPICKHVLTNQASRVNHIRLKHPNTRLLPCNRCDFVTDSSCTLFKHEYDHIIADSILPVEHGNNGANSAAGGDYSCALCGEVGTRTLIIHHIKLNHLTQLGIESYTCAPCNIVYYTTGQLFQHRKLMHPGTDPEGNPARVRAFKCDQCPSEFFHKRGLALHRETIHSGNRELLECKLCGAKLAHRKHQIKHMKEEHADAVKIKCRFCEAVFSTYSGRSAHTASKHTQKSVECSYCGKKLTNSYNLAAHQKKFCKEYREAVAAGLVPEPEGSSGSNNNNPVASTKQAKTTRKQVPKGSTAGKTRKRQKKEEESPPPPARDPPKLIRIVESSSSSSASRSFFSCERCEFNTNSSTLYDQHLLNSHFIKEEVNYNATDDGDGDGGGGGGDYVASIRDSSPQLMMKTETETDWLSQFLQEGGNNNEQQEETF